MKNLILSMLLSAASVSMAHAGEAVCYDGQKQRFLYLTLDHVSGQAVVKTQNQQVLSGSFTSAIIGPGTRTSGMTQYHIQVEAAQGNEHIQSIQLQLIGNASIPQFGSGTAEADSDLFSGLMLLSCTDIHLN